MSRRWRLTPARRSLPPEAISRFWVFKSTPRPALEMYSRPAQSSVTVPETLSRNACAAGHCAASSRPAITTVPAGPLSIVNIWLVCLPESNGAGALFERIVVADRVDHLAHEVDAEAAWPPLFDRQVDVGIGRRGDIEWLGVAVDDRHLDAVGDARDVDAHRRLALLAVLHHVGKELLQHEVDGAGERRGHVLAGERKDGFQLVERALEAPRRGRSRALHEHHRHVVVLPRLADEGADRSEKLRADIGGGMGVVARDHVARAPRPILRPGGSSPLECHRR